MKGEIYFERQSAFNNNCGVYALNNLVGSSRFSTANLDTICKTFSSDFINPHKHFFGGDYDVNILIYALTSEGYECIWLDNRKKSEICKDNEPR